MVLPYPPGAVISWPVSVFGAFHHYAYVLCVLTEGTKIVHLFGDDIPSTTIKAEFLEDLIKEHDHISTDTIRVYKIYKRRHPIICLRANAILCAQNEGRFHWEYHLANANCQHFIGVITGDIKHMEGAVLRAFGNFLKTVGPPTTVDRAWCICNIINIS